jgi:hypothetical protein
VELVVAFAVTPVVTPLSIDFVPLGLYQLTPDPPNASKVSKTNVKYSKIK